MREQEVLIGLGQQKHGGRDERIFEAKFVPKLYKSVQTRKNGTERYKRDKLGSKNTLIVSAVQCMP